MKPERSCFISAAYGEQLDTLQHALDQSNVSWQWATYTSVDQPILSSVVEAINKADFVVAVFHDRNPRENVLLEVGIAIGLGKPIFLLKTGNVEIPSDLLGTPLFTTDLKDNKLLSFQLDLFLSSLTEKPRPKRTSWWTTRPGRARAEDLPSPELFESALEQSVAAAIRKAGGRVTITPRTGKERTPDLLMWLPHVDKDLFNPAAIEVVSGTTNWATLQSRFASFIRSSGLSCGLIVVNSLSLAKEIRNLPPLPYIFVLTLNDLKDQLESSRLASWVKQERNRLAHGIR